MQELDLDLAGEYLVMAATLAHIKSKMLLPQTPDEQQDDADGGEEQDPRLELIRRLLEYQKYKAVADELGGRAVAGRDVFPRGMELSTRRDRRRWPRSALFKLLDAFQAILARTKSRLAFEITAERITIQERITQITERAARAQELPVRGALRGRAHALRRGGHVPGAARDDQDARDAHLPGRLPLADPRELRAARRERSDDSPASRGRSRSRERERPAGRTRHRWTSTAPVDEPARPGG